MDKPRIGITIGDLNGIGPEVVIKALADTRLLSFMTPVIYGSTRVLSHYRKLMSIEHFNYTQLKPGMPPSPKVVNVVNCWEEPIEILPGQPSTQTARGALLSLLKIVEDVKNGLIDGIVTAPIDKNTIHCAEFPYRGHTEFLAQTFSSPSTMILMVGNNLKVGMVTEHVPLQKVAPLITQERVEHKILLLEKSLIEDFLIRKPKIAVLGLNPHAGDGGLLGKEEKDIIKPVIMNLKNKGKIIFGPFPADGFFATEQYLHYDTVLAMYHDQALIGFKTISFQEGINYTVGLPTIRTSPDHGTAYDIAGQNIANENSMRQAIYTACDLIKNRS